MIKSHPEWNEFLGFDISLKITNLNIKVERQEKSRWISRFIIIWPPEWTHQICVSIQSGWRWDVSLERRKTCQRCSMKNQGIIKGIRTYPLGTSTIFEKLHGNPFKNCWNGPNWWNEINWATLPSWLKSWIEVRSSMTFNTTLVLTEPLFCFSSGWN